MPAGSLLSLAAISFCIASAAGQKISSPQTYERFDGCVLVPSRWNDGDTFRARLPDGREENFRLYFVDAPEVRGRLLDRHEDQEKYFGLESDVLKELAQEASRFTTQALARPFTIHTRWRPVFASNRYYAFVVTAEGTNLIEELIANGLAQIHGHRARTPDGRSVENYGRQLSELEKKAKQLGRGAWKR